MNDQHDATENLANVSTDLSTLRDARARVRIDAAARNADRSARCCVGTAFGPA